MNRFDHTLLLYLTHLAHELPILTKVVVAIYFDQLKYGLFVALFWWAWFDTGDTTQSNEVREKIAAGLVGSVVCVVVVRLIVLLFPFRLRPLSNPLIGLDFPQMNEVGWAHWSSFPSDNAALFFFLTICLFSVSRWLGWIALADTIVICFTRVFVGVHYPTDILAGALLGIAAGCLIIHKRIRDFVSRPMLDWTQAHPASFYASSFLFSFVLAHTFFPVLNVLLGLRRLIQLLVH